MVIKVFLLCPGLGNVKRGFETFTQECFQALSQEPALDITLFQGGGESSKKIVVLPNLSRESQTAIQLGKITKRGAYYIEQVSFGLSFLAYIQSQQPDIIYFSDGRLGNLLWHWRRFRKQNYKLLFSNGGPLSPPFSRWDLVQQVTPTHLEIALASGETMAKHKLVPYGINVSRELEIVSQLEIEALRSQLKLPQKRKIVLSVGAINKSHKRMDYVVREIASLAKPRPYLLLLGQQDSESAEILQLGYQLLGKGNFQMRTVAAEQMADYYKVADIFVLASLSEGFGRVFLEAMSYGLPCLAHDYEVTRFVLGEEGFFANFELSGSLRKLVSQVLTSSDDIYQRHQRHQRVYQRFSWEKLLPSYVAMIRFVALNEGWVETNVSV
ncbi:MAG: glycosyltransferase family 4 protein [Kamptonema sp. SIO1D9]|nr:glycosyltransferase family 4 protein [Kamptonema sp. SIO1D9]